MENLIKSELYKLRKSKVFIKMLLITLIPLLLGLGLHIFKPQGDEILSLIVTFINNRKYGFTMNDFSNIKNLSAQDFLFSAIGFTAVTYMILVYFVGNIVVDEYVDKTIMHKINYGYSRTSIYISKLIVSFIGVSIIALFPIILNTLIGGLMYEFGNFDILKISKFLTVYMLLLYSSTSFYVLLASIMKIKSELMGFGVLILLLPAFLTEKNVLYLTKYIPYGGLLDICGKYPSNEVMVSLGLNAIIVIIITSTLGCILINKQDIK
ncbi:ABC transporter permease [Romboutsia hominis]|uniref:ABC-2 family transporter protein n=1 Tax=Romboutsia hominis TaxID=1507512 RepID=A0A2P2BS76_9FIRM|nr:ABC transporter permease [Romboutsia hominis]CEI73225.1 ABC-2 family transporter protein [Romboutsia hominis]